MQQDFDTTTAAPQKKEGRKHRTFKQLLLFTGSFWEGFCRQRCEASSYSTRLPSEAINSLHRIFRQGFGVKLGTLESLLQ